ncbi:response regulator receiver modulated CheB methylesterase [Gloeothece citriformis PCC 7424]|uniref:protein-glutamate methylesterase n=1 Tax=Gloeothece citriformis (strain PCC 7424) TaxID=65393 RepID=B7K9J3_GLOC7|nr:chemotaxis response regulator protein-glutamate methylesterase [Gloeothece citriformis]ACK69961.1 response regulator receiver modulated CheB methylesterase [Gloeothece citriformis PCC 7424]
MKIAIVNQTGTLLEFLRRTIATVPDYQIIWTATDGVQAISNSRANPPDLILMDMMRSNLDGAKTTQEIMKQSPCPILMVTDSLKRDSSKIFEAMSYGALDVVHLPFLNSYHQSENSEILLNKIAMIGTLTGLVRKRKRSLTPLCSLPFLVIIGASTGGPGAIAFLLSQLPVNFPAAIVVVQHLDYQFVPDFVQWLDRQTPLTVLLAHEGNRPEIGKVLLAGSNDHLFLSPNLTLTYTQEPLNYPFRPSVDVFFKSVAQHWHRKGIAILLTGMGKDGAQGLSQLREAGWHTIAQDQQSSVIYGMPKAAVELNAATQVLSLEAISLTLLNRLTPYS